MSLVQAKTPFPKRLVIKLRTISPHQICSVLVWQDGPTLDHEALREGRFCYHQRLAQFSSSCILVPATPFEVLFVQPSPGQIAPPPSS